MSRYRTHTCNDLRAAHIGETVTLSGWLHMVRDVGGILFLVLRDHYGSTQIAVDPADAFYDAVKAVRVESTIRIAGTVRARPEGGANSRMTTGEIEVRATEFELLAASEILPFQVQPNINAS